MNIFKALSQGDGSINETNITSFLSFICNDSNDFSSSFMVLFIELINKELSQQIIPLEGIYFRQKIHFLESRYSYSAQPEFRIVGSEKSHYVDIFITITTKNNEEDLFYLLIENKIKKNSFKLNQCLEQYQSFSLLEDYKSNAKTISLLISPNDEKFSKMIHAVQPENLNSAWLKWDSNDKSNIINLFKNLIQLENECNIPPIESNTKYILKSFIDYISSAIHSNSKNGNYNFSIAGAEVVEECEVILDGNKFSIKRYDNKMIRVYTNRNEEYKYPVKPFLRKVIEVYALKTSLEYQPGKEKNTQVLGRDIIQELNK